MATEKLKRIYTMKLNFLFLIILKTFTSEDYRDLRRTYLQQQNDWRPLDERRFAAGEQPVLEPVEVPQWYGPKNTSPMNEDNIDLFYEGMTDTNYFKNVLRERNLQIPSMFGPIGSRADEGIELFYGTASSLADNPLY